MHKYVKIFTFKFLLYEIYAYLPVIFCALRMLITMQYRFYRGFCFIPLNKVTSNNVQLLFQAKRVTHQENYYDLFNAFEGIMFIQRMKPFN